MSREEILALADRFTKPAAIIPAQVIQPSASDWSSHDPACRDRLIRSVIGASLGGVSPAGVFEAGRASCGCPEEVYQAIRADAGFMVRYRQLVQEEVVAASLPLATQNAMLDGGAYGMAQSLNSAPKEDLSDDEKRRAAAFARMGPAELLKEVERHEKVMAGFKEKLMAGKSPPPEKIQQLAEAAVGPMGDQPRGESAAPLDAP